MHILTIPTDNQPYIHIYIWSTYIILINLFKGLDKAMDPSKQNAQKRVHFPKKRRIITVNAVELLGCRLLTLFQHLKLKRRRTVTSERSHGYNKKIFNLNNLVEERGS